MTPDMQILTDIGTIVSDLLALAHSDGAAKLVADVKQVIADFKAGKGL